MYSYIYLTNTYINSYLCTRTHGSCVKGQKIECHLTIEIVRLQGAFSLCRVIKRSEQGLKIGAFPGECKTKSVVSSIKKGVTPRILKSKASRTSEGSPSHSSNLFDGSNDSTPIKSPSQIQSTMEVEPTVTQSHYASSWMTHDLVPDSSEVYYHQLTI